MAPEPTTTQAAPGQLESVRRLLNSWRIPNDTRVAVDRFEEVVREYRLGSRQAATLRLLRDDLRTLIEKRADPDRTITRWLDRLAFKPAITKGRLEFRRRGGAAAEMVAVVVASMIDGTWSRLKACPDCRWVFYDHTRNGNKRWCLMNAGSEAGRGCGNIAKVRRHRERRKSSAIGARAPRT